MKPDRLLKERGASSYLDEFTLFLLNLKILRFNSICFSTSSAQNFIHSMNLFEPLVNVARFNNILGLTLSSISTGFIYSFFISSIGSFLKLICDISSCNDGARG